MVKKYNSRILAEVHESAIGMHNAGLISDERMEKYDDLCIEETPQYTPQMIVRVRRQYKLTQSTFASVLNTSVSTVQKWERGINNPSGPCCKLIHLIEKKGISSLL